MGHLNGHGKCPSHSQHDEPSNVELVYHEKRCMLQDMWGLIKHYVYLPGSNASPDAQWLEVSPQLSSGLFAVQAVKVLSGCVLFFSVA
jgi:hypothetical protein